MLYDFMCVASHRVTNNNVWDNILQYDPQRILSAFASFSLPFASFHKSSAFYFELDVWVPRFKRNNHFLRQNPMQIPRDERKSQIKHMLGDFAENEN